MSKDPKSERFGRENPRIQKWNSQQSIEMWRENWAKVVNRELERKNIVERVDHRSYERQGIDKIPSKHIGVQASQMEKRGIQTDLGNINRKIQVENSKVHEINSQIRHLKAEYLEVHTDMQIQSIEELLQSTKRT